MEMIKHAIKLGNSAGVILPKGWENRKVKVELVEDSITDGVLDILKEEGLLADVVGIYIAGSYARGEETPESDIDILIITNENNKVIRKARYEILLVSKERLERNMGKSLYLNSMIREAKAILNEGLIDSYKKGKIHMQLDNLLKEIISILKINLDNVEIASEMNDNVMDGVVYSTVLRLREIILIECILKDKPYSRKELLKVIEKKGSLDLYEAYLRIKNDSKPRDNLDPSEVRRVLIYSLDLAEDLRKKYGKKR
jgi:predicted nucleotidyltransferase